MLESPVVDRWFGERLEETDWETERETDWETEKETDWETKIEKESEDQINGTVRFLSNKVEEYKSKTYSSVFTEYETIFLVIKCY